jgi:hypothetical protein
MFTYGRYRHGRQWACDVGERIVDDKFCVWNVCIFIHSIKNGQYSWYGWEHILIFQFIMQVMTRVPPAPFAKYANGPLATAAPPVVASPLCSPKFRPPCAFGALNGSYNCVPTSLLMSIPWYCCWPCVHVATMHNRAHTSTDAKNMCLYNSSLRAWSPSTVPRAVEKKTVYNNLNKK